MVPHRPVCSAFGLLGPTTERPRAIESGDLGAAPAPTAGWSRPHGQIHKMTLAVRDPAESVAFCERYLGCTEIEVPDATLCPRSVPFLRHRS